MKKTFLEGERVGCAIDETGECTAKVKYDGEYTDEPIYGKVTDILPGGKVKVLWDDDNYNDHSQVFSKTTGKLQSSLTVPREIPAKFLLPEAEMKAKFSSLEKEYEAVAKQIKVKLVEAGKLIKEANKMAKKAGADSLADMYDAIDPLESAMDSCGWRTSSWNC
jgi:hypothetical protein